MAEYITDSPYKDITYEEYNALLHQISQASVFVNSVEELKDIDVSDVSNGYQVGLSGHGGGSFYWDSDSEESENGGTIVASNITNSGRWKRIFQGEFVRPEWFGEGFDGLLKAWSASKFIELNPKTTYTFEGLTAEESRLIAYDEPVHIRGNGARLEQVTNEPLIALRGGWEGVQNVSAISDDRLTITVEDGSKYKRGDVLKIRNDEGMQDFQSRHKGEFFVVYDLSGNTITARQSLRFNYSLSNCKIAKIKEHKIIVEDLEVEYTPTDEGNGEAIGDSIYIENALEAVVKNINSPFGFGNIIAFRDSYAAAVKDINIGYEANKENSWQEGTTNYGVRIENSELCRIDGGTYRNGRHAVDLLGSANTGLDYLKPNGDEGINGAGLSRNCLVTNWVADGGSNAPFSSHHGSENIHWVDCTARNSRNIGFQFRGVGHHAEGCQTFNCPIGFRAFVQSSYFGEAQTHNITFKDCIINDPMDSAFELRDNTQEVMIDGCTVMFTSESDNRVPLRIIDVRDEGKVQVYNTKVIARRSITRLRDFIEFQSVSLGETVYLTMNGVEIVAPAGADAGLSDIIRVTGEGNCAVKAFNVRAFALFSDTPICDEFMRGNMAFQSVLHNIFLPEYSHDRKQYSDGEKNLPFSHGNDDAASDNYAFGDGALENVTPDANYNIAVGDRALKNAGDINGNIAIGHSSAEDVTSADDNTIIGHESARDMVSPRDGSDGGPITDGSQSLTTGQKNILIGRRASVASSDTENAIVIGVSAVGESGELTIGSHSYNVGFDNYHPYDSSSGLVGYVRIKLNDRYFRVPLYADEDEPVTTTTA